MNDETLPPPSIDGLSERSQHLLIKQLHALSDAHAVVTEDQLTDTLDSLRQDLDGQPLAALEETLDWLRDAGLYSISAPLLEEAWAAELPLDFLGRVAQDWVGSILFGLGDERGAMEVATFLEKRAIELGPSLCRDLSDLWIEWGLFESAEPLALSVHTRQPGEQSALFHLLLCAKMRGDWEQAEHWLKRLDEARVGAEAGEAAVEWNRGLIAVVRHDWATAVKAWERVGFSLPEQIGSGGDYATPGELCPVRLKISLEDVERSEGRLPRSEVVWGRRIGPARIELSGLPYHHPHFRSGDILLVDGVREGQVDYNGQSYPVVPALEVWKKSSGETLRFYGIQTQVQHVIALDRLAQKLGGEGWPISNWTRLVRRETSSGEPLLQVGLYLSPDRELSQFKDELEALIQDQRLPELFCPRYAELTGGDVHLHQSKWLEWGVE